MARTTHPYAVLGLPAGANAAQIRQAYFHLALECHPERTGEGDTERFIGARQAYEQLTSGPSTSISAAVPPGSYSERRRRERFVRPVDVPTASYSSFRHAREFGPGLLGYAIPDPFDWSLGMLDPQDLMAAGFVHDSVRRRPLEDLDFDLVLSPDEAAEGGVVPFTVPIRHRCRACGGTGGSLLFACAACSGIGHQVHEHPLEMVFTPGVRDGQTASLPLDPLGVRGASVHVRVAVR